MKRDFTFKASPAFKSTTSLTPIKYEQYFYTYKDGTYKKTSKYYNYYTEKHTNSWDEISGYYSYISGTKIIYGSRGYMEERYNGSYAYGVSHTTYYIASSYNVYSYAAKYTTKYNYYYTQHYQYYSYTYYVTKYSTQYVSYITYG